MRAECRYLPAEKGGARSPSGLVREIFLQEGAEGTEWLKAKGERLTWRKRVELAFVGESGVECAECGVRSRETVFKAATRRRSPLRSAQKSA
jgi:hypothetical protein